MKRNGKTSASGDRSAAPDAPHPFETLLRHISTEPIDPDDAKREAAWARQLRQAMDGRIAALRRQLTPSRPATRKPAVVSAELRALARDALLARVANLRQAPEVRIAHLELSRLSDDDLRQLIAEIENVERTQV